MADDSDIDFAQIIIDQTKLLASATETVTQILENFDGLFKQVEEISLNNEKTNEAAINELAHEKNKIATYIEHVHVEIPAYVDGINKLERQNREFQNRIKELEKQNDEATLEIERQSTYSAAMGSTLGKMLWKTSKSEAAIQTYINTGTLNQFLNLANNTLCSFQESYSDDLPAAETFESNFLLSLLGLATNISAQQVGRDFMLNHEMGLSLFTRVLEYLGELKMPSGKTFKRLILMFLYNFSVNERGAELIKTNERVIDNIMRCLDETHPEEIQQTVLLLLDSLVNELKSTSFCKLVFSKISRIDNVKTIMNDYNNESSILCEQLVHKLQCVNDGDPFDD